MKKIIPLVLCVVLLLIAVIFGLWAFAGRQDYKNNADQKIANAVKVAKQQQQLADNQTFNEAAKQPLKSYVGPATYGSVTLKYPKTWSAFITAGQSDSPLNGYFYPDYIPDLQTTSFALRVQVVSSSYAQQMQNFTSQVSSGKVKISAYTAPKVPGTLGSRIDGAVDTNKQGIMVLFPIRDKTLKIWTEADSFRADFLNNILPNITFSP